MPLWRTRKENRKNGQEKSVCDATDLFLGETFGALRNFHRSETDADGARADENDLVTKATQVNDSFDDGGQDRKEWLVRLFMDDGRCAYSAYLEGEVDPTEQTNYPV